MNPVVYALLGTLSAVIIGGVIGHLLGCVAWAIYERFRR